jgi:hypothetical protein
MAKNWGSEVLIGEDIKLFVTYEWESRVDMEECHGYHAIMTTYVDVKTVELVIDESGIDITDKLSRNQLVYIENQLNIY